MGPFFFLSGSWALAFFLGEGGGVREVAAFKGSGVQAEEVQGLRLRNFDCRIFVDAQVNKATVT